MEGVKHVPGGASPQRPRVFPLVVRVFGAVEDATRIVAPPVRTSLKVLVHDDSTVFGRIGPASRGGLYCMGIAHYTRERANRRVGGAAGPLPLMVDKVKDDTFLFERVARRRVESVFCLWFEALHSSYLAAAHGNAKGFRRMTPTRDPENRRHMACAVCLYIGQPLTSYSRVPQPRAPACEVRDSGSMGHGRRRTWSKSAIISLRRCQEPLDDAERYAAHLICSMPTLQDGRQRSGSWIV
jgi:hypothetical protein